MKILVVDDNERIRKLIIKLLLLDNTTLSFHECSSAEEAFKSIKEEMPELILMDIVMDKLDGLTAAKYIHAFYPEIKIVIVSQLPEQEYKEEALNSGAIEYVNKENLFQLTTLIQAIK